MASDVAACLHEHYSQCLSTHGDTARGADWLDETGRLIRFDVGLDIIQQAAAGAQVVLCDLGCGTGELYRRIRDRAFDNIAYVGLDQSPAAIAMARAKFPEARFEVADAGAPADLARIDCDFVFANGLFTVKGAAAHEDMWAFMAATLEGIWPRVRRGIVFNVMSKIVDWERADLFHVSYDELARFLHGLAGRFIGFRADYGLYELMAYALKPVPVEMPAAASSHIVPVCRPSLPTADQLRPYLRALDQGRRYTNHGPLADALSARLRVALGAGVCLAASGTAGLLGVILAEAGRASDARPLALCSAHTFVATASAIELAGYRPHALDVDAESWALDPAVVAAHPELGRVGLVAVTAPYGRPVPQAEWRAFSQATGVKVVIDGAAAFEALTADPQRYVGEIPVVLSLHATKAFSTAEGGAVVCTDQKMLEKTWAALNFGFLGRRECAAAGTNGKMSEYHAAIGLSELERWPSKKAAFGNVARSYARAAAMRGIADRIVAAPDVASCYCLFNGRDGAECAAVEEVLAAAGIETRRWYGFGLHHEPFYRNMARDALPNAEALGRRLLGLPMAMDLPEADVERVVEAIARCLTSRGGEIG
ncbi:DegT/DnrJ/EryC1/StrS family aminotransferase [Xanthobacter sp. V0B-10]|uniref:DegT/DnrJ/EryC1/StrS family aminotransferase n=1 Tax=Xanthobacter albus TaxID=3119929 RepID=UPI0037287546